MLILPPGHARTVAARGPAGARERRILAAVTAVAVVLVVAIIVSVSGGSAPARRGCLDITYASSTGALTITGCGADARSICAAAETPRGYTGLVGAEVARRCRQLGLPVG